ncbi:MAG: M23 family metallopeptidase [Methylococcaceae bacterium]
MKNSIYTYLLLGICAAFSVTGYTQTKPANKQAKPKITQSPPPHSKPTKINPKSVVKIKSSDKKSPNKLNPTSKKDLIAKTSKIIASKKTIASSKSTTKKHNTAPEKLISTRRSASTSRPTDKYNSLVSSGTRRHSIISTESAAHFNHNNVLKNTTTNLNFNNAETDQIIQTNNDKPFQPLLINRSQPTKINTAHVSIETSLFLDGLEADLSKELILQLTDIFAWDIDFATNLRPGDQFTVVYGKKTIDGKETDVDDIIAAEFINQGSSHTAVRYISESGIASYYTPEGESMQRAFLSTPVDFAKISSPFDMHRMHPILNRIRAHKGIDYAARMGTPVKTTGDGTVSFSGSKGAYGQVVIVNHNDRYETLYAHMSKFKQGLTVGNHVKQGDVIGYVGQSGLATGPHLHYEFHVDGQYRDPDSVKIPHSMPISSTLLADFNAQTRPYFAQLNQVKSKSLLAKTHSAPRYAAPEMTQPPALMQSSHYDYD